MHPSCVCCAANIAVFSEVIQLVRFREVSHHPSCVCLCSECRRIFHHLHNVNNQRSDRMSMAWGVEARVPFLDPDVIDAVMKVCV